MKKILPAILILVLISCKKSESPILKVRVQNNTNIILDSVHLTYDVTYYNFGTISVNATTPYHSYQTLPTAPTADVFINQQRVVAGRLFAPNSYPYPALDKGNYILKIFTDTTLPSGLNATFIKE